jgi:hypothetical protein
LALSAAGLAALVIGAMALVSAPALWILANARGADIHRPAERTAR